MAGAEGEAVHARLALEGATVGLDALAAEVQAAQVDEALDVIVSDLPKLGDELLNTLNAIETALSAYVTAADAFDAYAARALITVNSGALNSPRVRTPRYGVPTVDRTSLAQARGDRLLAAIATPFLEQLHAPAFVTRELRTVAQAAVAPPTTEN